MDSEDDKQEANYEKLKDFFFGKPAPLEGQAKEWLDEGKCPKCGELGRVHLSTFVCSKHGQY